MDVADMIREADAGTSVSDFLGVVIRSECSGVPGDKPPFARLIAVRGLRGVELSMWTVREEKP